MQRSFARGRALAVGATVEDFSRFRGTGQSPRASGRQLFRTNHPPAPAPCSLRISGAQTSMGSMGTMMQLANLFYSMRWTLEESRVLVRAKRSDGEREEGSNAGRGLSRRRGMDPSSSCTEVDPSETHAGSIWASAESIRSAYHFQRSGLTAHELTSITLASVIDRLIDRDKRKAPF